MDANQMNSLIVALAEVLRFDTASALLLEMLDHGLIPNKLHYTCLIDELCRYDKVEEAFVLMVAGQKSKLTMQSCLVFPKLTEAQELFEKMVEKEVVPDAITYTAFIDGLCRNGKVDHAFKVFDEMQQRKTVPNSDTYSSLTYGLSSEGRVDEVKTLIEEMERKGIAPNAAIYTSLTDGYASLNRVNDAFSLLQEMVDRRLRFEPEYSTFRALMKGFTAKNLLDRMSEYGYEPMVDTCTTIVHGLYEDGKTREADDLWNTMEANGLSPNARRVFTPLITAHSRNLKVDDALDLHDSMIERGLEPDIESCTALIVALCKMRRVDEAASV